MNSKVVKINVAETIGTVLTTRLRGMRLRKQLHTILFEEKRDVFLNFSGVEILGNSFADEIAKLIAELKMKNSERGKLSILIPDPLYKKLLLSRAVYREKQLKRLNLESFPLDENLQT